MATAVRPAASVTVKAARILYPDVQVPAGGLAQNAAVAIIQVGDHLEYALCGSQAVNHPTAFAGFLYRAVNPGDKAALITGRGSVAAPLVENSIPLVPNQPVYISQTPGRVTQTPIDPFLWPGETSLRIGEAISTTEIILTTDAFIQYGG